ncbi:MAG: hypothetical protein WCR59_01090 [Planctomycetota bacterium]|jgi:hypothetical protein
MTHCFRRLATWFGACLWLAGCAAPLPRIVTVTPGEQTKVVIHDFANNRTFSLQNVSAGSRAEVYRQGAGDLDLKVVEDQRLQELLDVLAAQGMFQHSTEQPLPSARAAILVTQGERRMAWSRPLADPANLELIRAFDESRAYVLTVYNAATAYHSRKISDQDAAGLRTAIEAQKAKLEAQNAKQLKPTLPGQKQ